jgi:hypothetical protein
MPARGGRWVAGRWVVGRGQDSPLALTCAPSVVAGVLEGPNRAVEALFGAAFGAKPESRRVSMHFLRSNTPRDWGFTPKAEISTERACLCASAGSLRRQASRPGGADNAGPVRRTGHRPAGRATRSRRVAKAGRPKRRGQSRAAKAPRPKPGGQSAAAKTGRPKPGGQSRAAKAGRPKPGGQSGAAKAGRPKPGGQSRAAKAGRSKPGGVP